MEETTLLQIKNLNLSFTTNEFNKQVLFDVNLSLKANSILGVVGESGSGKSVTALSILKLFPQKITEVSSGTIVYREQNLLDLPPKSLQSIRGNEISMIFQEPMSSLNPSMRCGKQVEEIIRLHQKISAKAAKTEVLSLFEKVKLPDVSRAYSSYPHQLSGGQKQRVMIAMAIACRPKILIADEPTTALDVTVQKEIIKLLQGLQREYQMSIIFISHDLSLVSEIADEVAVMYQGRVVEYSTVSQIFHHPKQSYTQALLKAKPSMLNRPRRLPTIKQLLANKEQKSNIITPEERKEKHKTLYSKPPLLEVKNLEKTFFTTRGFMKKKGFKAVDDVSFNLYEGETLGLVGESGCGKSTLGNLILNLETADRGAVYYKGQDITNLSNAAFRSFRKDIQLIFQDPFASLNPRLSVGQAILEPMQAHRMYASQQERKDKVIELLEAVGLSAEHYNRYPHEFSGGQRQRIGIARTIALAPKLIICDESVSALDISVQAQVLNLLNDLKEEYGFTYLFISHDLSVVKYMSDQLLVMSEGKIVEKGEADEVYANPKNPYTQKLIQAIPKGII
ncbi:ABC transporter ATP-binding protein [Aquimarina brevivitae]|uniref:Peptide/nickel transport system ATP-binding protein n=1 Tax=Aquimarina brevivitae TaxID=323412 RepID=A0A4Q7PFE9_9FLAO|nr:ABC transporter ATP-binding protein [Aquimarina brevivitae]RZS99184.1 peptide/nickel transport system ATP-binding protein [Aquimarina brevivitae]